MNKRIIGLVLAGLICVGGQVKESYANENLKEEVQVKTEKTRTQNGWVKNEYGDWNYYKNGEMLKERWLKDNGKWYYFDWSGRMLNEEIDFIGNKTYIFDKSGAMIEKKGWIYLAAGDILEGWYYGNGDGTVKTEQWIKDNGKWYYLGKNEDIAGKAACQETQYIDNKTYIFSSNCSLIEKKGWISLKGYDGDKSWYYGNGDGTVKINQWIKDNGRWYYAYESGYIVNSGTIEIGNKMYLFDTNGAMIEKKGWINFKAYNGNYYWGYGNGDGTVKINQWINDGGKWYYLEESGVMLKDESKEINGKEYTFDSNGVCVNP